MSRPIQLGIRLLIPGRPRECWNWKKVRRLVGPFDPQSLAYPLEKTPTRAMDALSETVQGDRGPQRSGKKESRGGYIRTQFGWQAHAAAGLSAPKISPPTRSQAWRFRFSAKPW